MAWYHFDRHTSSGFYWFDLVIWLEIAILTLCRIQWTLTPGAVISLCPHRVAGRPAKATKCMIHLLVPPRAVSGTVFRLPMETAQLSTASNILTTLPFPAWLYVEPCFLILRCAHASRRRRRVRHLALQLHILRDSKSPSSRQTA